MHVMVTLNDSKDATDLLGRPSTFVIEQSNAGPVVEHSTYFHVRGKIVGAVVPACISSIVSQVPEQSFQNLIECYEKCIEAAVVLGASTVIVRPLGTGIKKTTSIPAQNKVIADGLWGNLFWSHAKSSLAARAAFYKACSYLPGDVTVVFVVPKENFDDWDSAMQFAV